MGALGHGTLLLSTVEQMKQLDASHNCKFHESIYYKESTATLVEIFVEASLKADVLPSPCLHFPSAPST